MRLVALGVTVAALVVAGCGSGAPAASTEAAAPAATGASVTPVPATAAAPTAVPGAVTAPPVAAGAAELTAINVDFEPKELAASAGTVVINFHNRDNGIPHNLDIKDASGASVYQGEINVGPFDSQETVGDLAPGAYTFTCTVHPTMQGTLNVLP